MADTNDNMVYESPAVFSLSNGAFLHVRNAAESTMNAGSSLDHLFLVSTYLGAIELS